MTDRSEIRKELALRLRQDDRLKQALADRLAASRLRQEHPAAAEPDPHREEIAVTGIHCRFPGSRNAAEYLDSLLRQEANISAKIAARWSPKAAEDVASLQCGTLDDIFDFDNQLFRLSPREAEAMDPHHRLMLESVWGCIEDAGYAVDEFARRKTGVFIAMYNQDFAHCSRSARWEKESQIYLGTGNAHSLLPNRISYFFDLRGPSEIVDTACSSSLVALHRAVEAIRSGECAQAIVGGVSLILDPERLLMLQRLGILSPDGCCALFDAKASGQVMGEGVATMIVKRSTDAAADRDHVYGLIKASGVNHRGRRSGSLTMPDAASQIALIDDVYRRADIDAARVSYVEAHGNGGHGDIPELLAFQQRFRPQTVVGSVKGNIGCSEAAGGLSQSIKVLMAMRHGVMPATLNHASLPERAGLNPAACRVLTANRPLDELNISPGAPFVAAINAYGLGGVNAHVVVEQDMRPAPRTDVTEPVIVLISGRTPDCAKQAAGTLAAFLQRRRDTNVEDLAYTLAVGRVHYGHRSCLVAASVDDVLSGLTDLLQGSLTFELGPSHASMTLRSGKLRIIRSAPMVAAIGGWLRGETIRWRELLTAGSRIGLPGSPLLRRTFLPPAIDSAAPARPQPTKARREQREASLDAFLLDWVSRQCRLDADRVDAHTPLAHYGVDSVACVDLCALIDRLLNVKVSPVELSEGVTVSDIAALVQQRGGIVGAGAEKNVEERIGARLTAADEVDVRAIKSLASRKELFERQFAALEKSLVPLSGAELAAALVSYRDRFDLHEDINGNVWIFLRTGPGNTFDAASLKALLQVVSALREFADFARLKMLYLSHTGKDFSLGGHRKFFAEELERGRTDSIVEIGETYKAFLAILSALPCITVGVAYGSAQGGGMELLMALDRQIVWPGVKLGFPEARSGLIAGMGGISYLSSVVGAQRAMHMNIEGALIESDEAVRLGIISQVDDNPFSAALALGEAGADNAASLTVRNIVNRCKYDLMRKDVDEWVTFVCSGRWLDKSGKIREDFAMIEK